MWGGKEDAESGQEKSREAGTRRPKGAMDRLERCKRDETGQDTELPPQEMLTPSADGESL